MPPGAALSVTRRTVLATAAALVTAGRAQAASGQIEVVHWWTAGAESQAIRTIRRRLEAEGLTWVDTAVQGPDLAKAAAITRVLGGNAPTAMLWHAGLDLRDLWRDEVIRDIETVATAQNWNSVLPPEIAAQLKVDGRYVAIPADLHCGNWTFANNRLLREAGVAVPTTWPEVLTACETLRGTGVIPIAFGGQPWQEASVFVQIFTGIGGADMLRRFTVDHDPAASESPEMVESFATFARLKPFVDKANPNRSAPDTAVLLATNKAALHFSGDWARGDLNAAGMKPEVDYTCRSGPGNDGIFMAVVDAFCLPRTQNADELARQDEFARVTMSPEIQHDFNLLKGSIPVRSDVGLEGYDVCARMAARLSRGDGVVIPSTSMGMTTAMRLAMYDVVHGFWNTDKADPKAAARDLRIAIERNRV
jgi:glucose/mannose transport system substrate-binding protein